MYEKTPFFLLPYDTSFGAPLFAYDRSPMSREGKAYSTYLWNLPAGALLSMMEEENSSDPYFRTYLGAEKEYRRFVYDHYLDIPDAVKEGLAALGPIPPARSLSEKRQRVEDIRRFLAENYSYTRSPGKTPEGKDFITYFLTESKKATVPPLLPPPSCFFGPAAFLPVTPQASQWELMKSKTLPFPKAAFTACPSMTTTPMPGLRSM